MTKYINGILRAVTIGPIALALATTNYAQTGEDEWYDPTDWFDGNNVESDDTYDGYYDYSYVNDFDDDWTEYDAWGDDVWDGGYYDADYWDDYDWNSNASTTATGTTSRNTGSSTASTTNSSSSGANRQQSSSGGSSQSGDNASDRVYTYVLWIDPVAQGQATGSTASRNQQSRSGSSQTGKAQFSRLDGTIEGLKAMNLQRRSGATGTHTIAKIKLENGKSTVVSLGRTSQLKNANLKVGDKIQAIGRRGTIDGETVFVASKLKANGRTIEANPTVRLRPVQTAQSQSQGQSAENRAGAMTGSQNGKARTSISGEVANVMQHGSGSDRQHTLVDVRLENGQTKTLDFGPAASLDQIGLDAGDRITAQGKQKQVNGKDVLSVDLLRINGEKVSSVSQ